MSRFLPCLVPALLLSTGCGAQGVDPTDAEIETATAADSLAGQPAVQLAHAFSRSRQLAYEPGRYTRFAG